MVATSSSTSSGIMTAVSLLTANLSVHWNATIPILSPGRLFGSFWEEFLHAGDGGIYAEKIANRAMQLPLTINMSSNHHHHDDDNDDQDSGWTVLQGHVIRDASKPLNNITRHALWMFPAQNRPAVVRNLGFPGGMVVQPGEELQLSLFVHVQGREDHHHQVSLVAMLVQAKAATEPLRIITNATILPTSQHDHVEGWKKVVITMTIPHDENDASTLPYTTSIPCYFELRAESSTTTTTTTLDVGVGVTVVSLISKTNTWNHEGLFRHDVMAWLNESKPPFVRIPGGNYVEGLQWKGQWNWKQTLGPMENRPGHDNDSWGYYTSDGLGLLEYLLLAEQLGAQPLLVVPAGCTMTSCVTNSGDDLDGFVQDAIDAVEFAMGDPITTFWGAQRASAGHASPFVLQALGLGNENCRPEHLPHYAHQWLRMALAVRKHYPRLALVLGCESPEQIQTILELVPQIAKLDNLMYDIHQRHDPKSFLRHAHYFDTMARNNNEASKNGGIKMFVSEYSSPREVFPEGVDLSGAVAEAIYMLGMEANSDAIQLASYGDLVANLNDLNKTKRPASGIATILLDENGSFGTPSWVVQTLFMHHQPHALLFSSLSNAVHTINGTFQSTLPVSRWRNGGTVSYGESSSSDDMDGMLAVSVSTGGNQCPVVVKVANYGHASASINLQLPDYQGHLPREADLYWISSLAPTDRNSMQEPRRIRIRQKRVPVNLSARQVELFIAPFSLSALCLQLLPRIPTDVL